MAVTARQNLFKGVNPYLQSLLQTPGTREQPSEWRTFHGQFIVNLTNTLNSELPSNYVAKNERSLQLWGESDGVFLLKFASLMFQFFIVRLSKIP